MDFMTAAKTCIMKKYVDFNGRAQRSEYWFFYLFYILVFMVVGLVGVLISPEVAGILYVVLALGFFLPMLGVSVRRLHDVNRSGFWLFICLVPLVGPIILLYWLVIRGTVGPNRFGEDPLAPAAIIFD